MLLLPRCLSCSCRPTKHRTWQHSMMVLRVPMLAAALDPGLGCRGSLPPSLIRTKHPPPLPATTDTNSLRSKVEKIAPSKEAKPPKRKTPPPCSVLGRDLPLFLENQTPYRKHGSNAVKHMENPCRYIVRPSHRCHSGLSTICPSHLFRDILLSQCCPSQALMYSIAMLMVV
jgi:hypothetical protein